MPTIIDYKAVWEIEEPYYEDELSVSAFCDPTAIGDTASMQATASGFDGYEVSYAWQKSDDGDTWTSVGTGDPYEFTVTAADVGTFWRVTASATVGSATSDPIELMEPEH